MQGAVAWVGAAMGVAMAAVTLVVVVGWVGAGVTAASG